MFYKVLKSTEKILRPEKSWKLKTVHIHSGKLYHRHTLCPLSRATVSIEHVYIESSLRKAFKLNKKKGCVRNATNLYHYKRGHAPYTDIVFFPNYSIGVAAMRTAVEMSHDRERAGPSSYVHVIQKNNLYIYSSWIANKKNKFRESTYTELLSKNCNISLKIEVKSHINIY